MPERGWGMALWLLATTVSLVVWIGLAAWVAVLAEDRGQPPLPWFVVGLFLPIVGLLALLVLFPREPRTGPPTAEDAVAASAVARALAGMPNASVHQLVERTGLREREVLAQLRALQHLGRVTRHETGRYDLAPA